MYKPEVIRINISSSFMARARCKECGKGPDYYYNMSKPYQWQNVRGSLIYSEVTKRWIKSMLTSNWYFKFEPRHFRKLGDFIFTLEGKSYLPTFHRTRGSDSSNSDNVVEFVGCECGATIWAFNEKSTKDRPEITNRKGRYKYPQRFVY